MAQQLSSGTLGGSALYLGGGLLLVVFYLWLGRQQPGYNWLALAWLGLLGLQAPRCWWYQVTLAADGLHLRRWFTPPVYYPLSEFRELEATDKLGRPVRISLADGRAYLFQPRLKQAAWDLRYVPVAGFVEYWTERLREPAGFAGQVWPDDVL